MEFLFILGLIISVAIDFFLIELGKQKSLIFFPVFYVLLLMLFNYIGMSAYEKHLFNNIGYVTIVFVANYIPTLLSFAIIKKIRNNVLAYFAFKIITVVSFEILMSLF